MARNRTQEFEKLKKAVPETSRKALLRDIQTSIKHGDADRLKTVLEAVTFSDDNGEGLFSTPPAGTIRRDQLTGIFIEACSSAPPRILRALVEGGAYIDADGGKAIRNAIYYSGREAVRALDECGANIEHAIQSTPNSAVARALRDYISDRDKKPASGWAVIDAHTVSHTATTGQSPGLTTVFNFRAKEAATCMTVPGCAAPSAPVIRAFDEFADKALLREAKDKLAEANGKNTTSPGKFRM